MGKALDKKLNPLQQKLNKLKGDDEEHQITY